MYSIYIRSIKKTIKIFYRLVILLVTFIVAGIIALQSSVVQTRLADKVLTTLNESIDGDIKVGKITANPFKAVVIKDLAVIDKHPYESRVDTFFRAGYVTAKFNLRTLLSGNISIGAAKVTDGEFNLVIEPVMIGDSATTQVNLKRIFRLGTNPDKEKSVSDKEIFSIGDVRLENMKFTMRNFKRDASEFGYDGMNWYDLEVDSIYVKGRDLRMKGGVMSGTCDQMSFREKSGYVCRHLSGSTKVGNGKTIIENLRLIDNWSDVDIPDFVMSYKNTESWSDFINAVRMTGTIRRSAVSMNTLRFFAPALAQFRMTTTITGKFDGYVNDFDLKGIRFSTTDTDGFADKPTSHNGGISGELDGSVTGLPDSYAMMVKANVHKLTFSTHGLEKFVKGWAPSVNLDLDKFCKGERLTFRGRASGPLNRLHAHGTMHTDFGKADLNVTLRNVIDPNRPLEIGGSASTERLDIGRIMAGIPVGECDMRTGLNATFAKDSLGIVIDSLYVDGLDVLGYKYSNIAAVGTFSQDAFDGRIVCSDPNLNFLFQGIFSLSSKTKNALYQFYANLGYADLHALNIDKRGVSKMSLSTQANFTRISGEDIIGNISIKDVMLEDEHGRHDVGDIEIASHMGDELNRVRLHSAFAEGSYVGNKFLASFIRDIQNVSTLKELPSLYKSGQANWDNNRYELSFLFHNTKDVLSFFAPGAYIADSTALSMKITADGQMKANVKSGRIALKDKYLKGIKLSADNASGKLGGVMTIGELSAGPIKTMANKLSFNADADSLSVDFSYDNKTELEKRGVIHLGGNIFRDENDTLRAKFRFFPSHILLNGAKWDISSSDISFGGSDINIGNLSIHGDNQSIVLSGGYSPTMADTLRLKMDKFDISMLNAFSKMDLKIKGLLSGNAVLISPTKERTGLLLGMTCESGEFGGERIGTLRMAGVWNEERHGFNYVCRNELDGVQNLNAYGNFYPKTRLLEGKVTLDRLNVGYGMPFLNSIFSSMAGTASGEIDFYGPLDNLELSSKDLRLNQTSMKVDFTNVEYIADGPVSLSSKGVMFENVNVRDRFNAKGTVSGGILWDHFRNMVFDTAIRFDGVKALDTKEEDNPIFYGDISATGTVNITGPLDNLLLTADATTAKTGNLHIPLSSTSSATHSNLLTFVEPYKEVVIDPYEEMLQRLKEKEKKSSSFGVKIKVNATPSVTASIDIDPSTGNVLTGRGNGVIELEVRPSDGVFTINGAYNIVDGSYHFVALGLAKRDFIIQDGSSVKFNGDVMDSDLDINALYKTKASVGTLIADTTSTTRRTVECGIAITDRLSSPRLAFSINVPDLDPTTQARVETALNTQDKIQKQMIALLVTNSFLPDEQSGVTNSSTMLGSITDIMANQLNNILQKLNIPVDFGLDYQQNTSGSDIFDVAISTALFNNRVIVNGTIGNRQYMPGATTTEVVGDLDIDVKLDKPGALRLNLFSHSADQYSNYLDNTQRNGFGFTYQKEYDNFIDFIRNLFRSRRRKQEIEAERQQESLNRKNVRIRINADSTMVTRPSAVAPKKRSNKKNNK